MPHTFNYPAVIERDEDGRFVVTFPDFGWGATDGATLEEALDEAKDLLRELLTTTMRKGRDLPAPSRASKRRPLVIPPVQIALKSGPLRRPSPGQHLATPPRPRAEHCGKRGAADVEPGPCHEGRHNRRGLTPSRRTALSDR